MSLSDFFFSEQFQGFRHVQPMACELHGPRVAINVAQHKTVNLGHHDNFFSKLSYKVLEHEACEWQHFTVSKVELAWFRCSLVTFVCIDIDDFQCFMVVKNATVCIYTLLILLLFSLVITNGIFFLSFGLLIVVTYSG